MDTGLSPVSADGLWLVDVVGLVVAPGAQPTYDQWRACGATLTGLYSTAKWAIGDWLLFGEHHYESWTQAADELGYDAKTVQNYVRVADRFPKALRKASLSWHHHLRVAALPPAVAAHWLAQSEAAGWSCADLTMALRETHTVSLTLLAALERAVAGLNRVVEHHPDQTFVALHVTPHLMGLAHAAAVLREAAVVAPVLERT